MENDFLRIAKCGRAVGLKGELTLWPISNVEDRYRAGAQYHIKDNDELVIETIRPNKDHYIVKFEGINDRDAAQNLVNEILYAHSIEIELNEGEYFHHELIGKIVIDQDSIERSAVVSIIDNAASDLMELETGAVVPLRFIENVDDANIYVRVPEGLFDIFNSDS